MAAIDFQLELVNGVWSALRARPKLMTIFKPGNQQDVRQADGRARQRLTDRSPKDYPSLAVELGDAKSGVGVQQLQTTTPTFGVAAGSPGCDPIIPITVPLSVVAKFDSDKLGEQTDPETEIRAALMAGYPKLGGLSYVRSFTITNRRERDPNNGVRTIVTFRIAADLRLRASQLK